MPENQESAALKKVFSQNLCFYMKKFGKTPTNLSDELSIPYSTVLDWTHGRKYPRMDKVQVLSDYFKIMKSDLTEEKPTPVPESELDASEEALLKLFRLVPPADRGMVLQMIEAALKSRGLL